MSVKVGQTFQLNGLTWRVMSVSPSRAHCIARTPRTVTVRDRRHGRDRTFTAHTVREMDISAGSDLETLNSLERGRQR